MLVTDSNFQEASFVEPIVKNISFENTNLDKAEFFKTNLKGVDFSTSMIALTRFDNYSLKGIIVDSFQCAYLVGMLGVIVKE